MQSVPVPGRPAGIIIRAKRTYRRLKANPICTVFFIIHPLSAFEVTSNKAITKCVIFCVYQFGIYVWNQTNGKKMRFVSMNVSKSTINKYPVFSCVWNSLFPLFNYGYPQIFNAKKTRQSAIRFFAISFQFFVLIFTRIRFLAYYDSLHLPENSSSVFSCILFLVNNIQWWYLCLWQILGLALPNRRNGGQTPAVIVGDI